MEAKFSIWSVIILALLAAIPVVLWRISSSWSTWLRLPARLLAGTFAVLVLWAAIANTLFFLGIDH